MGRGNAKEAVEIDSTLPRLLGLSLKARGNNVSRLTPEILTFPVKHSWAQDADPKLIERSAKQLISVANEHPDIKFILPRPGCGNGKLEWTAVKPLLAELPDNVIIIAPWEERPQ